MYICFIGVQSVFLFSCKKASDFLAAKPDESQVVPTTLTDLQALLDNDLIINGPGQSGYPTLGETGADNYWIDTTILYHQFSPYYQQAYTWSSQMSSGAHEVNDWDLPYRVVLYCNEALEDLSKLKADGSAAYGNVKGGALFWRSYAFYTLAQIFAAPYDSIRSLSDPGIPLRQTSDLNEKLVRGTVQQTYDSIIGDCMAALAVLPPGPPRYPTRASRAAAYGLLARVWQTVGNHHRALLYSDSCLQLQSALLEYDTIQVTGSNPFNRTNPEILFSADMQDIDVSPITLHAVYVDTLLYSYYAPNDLRKRLFFTSRNGHQYFTGFYDPAYAFCGMTTAEVYLIRAESEAREGNTSLAMADLNTLLRNRWATGTFQPYTATDAMDALRQILLERRKELLFRGVRWTDLRRLNKDPHWAITLKRIVDGTVYTLPPNDPRYVLPISDNVLSFNPGMVQNPR
jgi:hypothetical protein